MTKTLKCAAALFMVDGAALHGNLEVQERIERDFPVAGKIDSGMPAEILTVLVHLLNFRQQDLSGM